MGKVVKYKDTSTGKVYNQDETVAIWADGSNMSAKEAYTTGHFVLQEIQEQTITDQEREEIFDFAKELMRSALLGHGGITPEQAIIYAKELYKLKDTI